MTRYFAPVNLPILAAVDLLTRPDAPRSCSSRTGPSLERSTTLNFSVPASSFVSMLLRSLPAPPYHQAADVSFLNSATPIDGFSEAATGPTASSARQITAQTT